MKVVGNLNRHSTTFMLNMPLTTFIGPGLWMLFLQTEGIVVAVPAYPHKKDVEMMNVEFDVAKANRHDRDGL